MEEVKKQTPEEMAKQADEQFLVWIKDGRYVELIGTLPTLGRYSLRNQMLILTQNPKATNVNGMNAWNYQKRHVKAGEKSLKILAPKFDSTVTTNPDGTFDSKTSEKATGYEVNFVFDISQTVGDPAREIFSDEKTAIDYYDNVSTALMETLKGFEFKEHNEIENNSYGLLDTKKNVISIRSDLSKEDTLYTLVNQIAAAMVLTRDRRNFKGLFPDACPNIINVEASAATAAIARHLKLKAPNLIEPNFVELGDEKITKFAENMGVIRAVSQRMITATESAVAKRMQEEAQKAKEQAKAAQNPTEPKPEFKEPATVATVADVKTKANKMTKAEAALA